jgi:hypothetical protein
MTERDWRIFREDFNISYKVTINPHVLKSLVSNVEMYVIYADSNS